MGFAAAVDVIQRQAKHILETLTMGVRLFHRLMAQKRHCNGLQFFSARRQGQSGLRWSPSRANRVWKVFIFGFIHKYCSMPGTSRADRNCPLQLPANQRSWRQGQSGCSSCRCLEEHKVLKSPDRGLPRRRPRAVHFRSQPDGHVRLLRLVY